ncbi:MAG: tetratricopeptide repeat protein [Bacteroidia bacterium]
MEELPNDTNSVTLITRYGNIEKKINLNSALSLYLLAYNRAKLLNNNYMVARSGMLVGSVYGLLTEFEKESKFLAESKKIAESLNDKPLLVRIYITLANMYSYNGQTRKALEIFDETLKLCDEIGEQSNKGSIYNNIGGIIYRESNLNTDSIKRAITYIKKSVKIAEKSYGKDDLVSKYCNLGLMYCDISQYDSALYFMDIARQHMPDSKTPDDLITYYNFLGRIYTDLKDYKLAEKNYFLSLEESRKLNNLEWVSEAYLALSDLYIAKKNYAQAIDYLRSYYQLKDSIINVTNFAKAADIQNKLEREKKEAELSQLKAEQAKNRIFNIGLIIVSLLVIVSGVMMYSRFKIKAESEKKLKLQNEIISQKNKDITDSINYSRKIQDAILPSNKSITELFPDNFVLYKPKDIISGDFYWCAQNGNLKFFAVADCTGHGVPGALMSMLGTSLLKEIILTKNITQTGEVLNELRKLVINALDEHSTNKDGMDIALICIDEKNRRLHFSGANNSIFAFQNKSFAELKPNKQPIGKYEKMEGFSTQTIEITGETIVYLYTDGFADQFGGPKGKKFKYRQLNDLIHEITSLPLAQQKEILNKRFEEWKHLLEQVDDVCVAGLKITV